MFEILVEKFVDIQLTNYKFILLLLMLKGYRCSKNIPKECDKIFFMKILRILEYKNF